MLFTIFSQLLHGTAVRADASDLDMVDDSVRTNKTTTDAVIVTSAQVDGNRHNGHSEKDAHTHWDNRQKSAHGGNSTEATIGRMNMEYMSILEQLLPSYCRNDGRLAKTTNY